MAFIKGDQLSAVDQTLVTAYNEVFNRVESNVADLVATQPVQQKAFVHAFKTGYPNFRKWTGEKIAKSVKAVEIAGTTEKWESTVEIDVEDMMSGLLTPLLGDMENLGDMAATYLDRAVAEFLQNGTSTDAPYLNYDGASLFGNHTLDSGVVQSNNLTSLALNAANLITAYETVMGFKNPNGDPLNLMPTHLLVPNSLYLTAKALVENPIDASGATNVMYNKLKVVYLPELNNQSTTWYLTTTKGSSKPFMNYELEGPTFSSKNSPQDDNFFWSDKIVHGVTVRHAVKAGPWQLCLRCIA